MTRIPVMILNWNGWEDTFRCLRSLQNSSGRSDVWLVDNGSREDRSDEARSLFNGLRVLRWDDNYGWTGGYNRALRVASEEGYSFAYLLNNDCEVTPEFMSHVLDAALSDTRLAAVGSRVAYAEPAGFLIYDGEYYPYGGRPRPLCTATGIKRVREVYGAGMLVRLQTLEEEGYFDERFFCYHEETEWCWRVAARGWALAVAQESLIIHRVGGSDENTNALYYRTRNQFLLQERSHAAPEARTLAFNSALRDANSAYRRGDRQQWQATACGLRDGMRRRFGRRSAERTGPAFHALMHWWILCQRCETRINTLTGARKRQFPS